MLLPGHLLTSDWRIAMMRASTKSEVPQVALQDDRKNNADGHCDWEQNLPEFLQESIQAMVSAWDKLGVLTKYRNSDRRYDIMKEKA